ncbi:MAG TPA: hypothetical protein VFW96_28765 [Thermomicrobiales bacterium]|nr:hypothetical protein [Thermomicrobiales bacterium]
MTTARARAPRAVRACAGPFRRHLAAGRWRFGLAALALAVVCICGAYQVRVGHTVHVGVLTDDKPYVVGMNQPEQTPAGRYRWTTADSAVTLPGLGRGPYRLTLHLAGSANPRPRVEVLVDGARLATLDVTSGFRDYTVAVPSGATASGDMTVELRSSAFQPPNDQRTLGVVVDRVTVTPTGDPGLLAPPVAQFWRLLALVALAYLLAAVAGFGPRGAALGAAALAAGEAALLVANRPFLTVWTGELLAAACWGVALALALRLVLPPLYRLAGLRLGLAELRWPVALAAVFFVAHFGGDLHPTTNIVDLGFHIHRYEDVNERGRWVLMVESREWGTRDTVYPPAAYLFMRPLRPLMPDIRRTILLFMALAEATRLCVVYLVARKATRDPLAGACAALVFAIVPMAYLPFSWGIATNVFGAWCTTALFAILALGYDALRRPALAALATAVVTLALLSHPGEFVLAITALGGALVLFGALVRPRWRGGWPVLVGVAAVASALAFVLLYRHVAAEMLADGAQTVRNKFGGAGTTGKPAGWRVGGAIDDPIIGLKGYRVTTVPALLVGGLVGYWREAVGYYYLWPPLVALGSLGLMRGTKDLERLRLTSVLWWAVAALFALAGLLLNLYVRYAYFLMPAVAAGAGFGLARLCRVGRWGRLVAALLLAGTTIAGLWFWYLRIAYDGH